jgi:hypothetical protein
MAPLAFHFRQLYDISWSETTADTAEMRGLCVYVGRAINEKSNEHKLTKQILKTLTELLAADFWG